MHTVSLKNTWQDAWLTALCVIFSEVVVYYAIFKATFSHLHGLALMWVQHLMSSSFDQKLTLYFTSTITNYHMLRYKRVKYSCNTMASIEYT